MLRETEKDVRAMLDIADKPNMIPAPKVINAVDRLALYISRVHRQHGIKWDTLAACLAALGTEGLVITVAADGKKITVEEASKEGLAFRETKINTAITVKYEGVECAGVFLETFKNKVGEETVRVRLSGDTAKHRDVPVADVRLRG